jgi:hypothetical protein
MLLNLLSEYSYQLEFRFQYHFGITAFLLLLTVMNWKDLRGKMRKYLLLVSIAACFVFYSGTIMFEMASRITAYRENHESFEMLEDTLDAIPEDASVNASTFLLPHLAQRWEAYDVDYHVEADTDLVILDIRSGYNDSSKKAAQTAMFAGYTKLLETTQIAIFVSPDWEGDPVALKNEIRAVATVVFESKTANENLDDMKAIVSVIPDDASVNASSSMIPYISEREQLFDMGEYYAANTDFIVFDLRFGHSEVSEFVMSECLIREFSCLIETEDIAIYVNPFWKGDFSVLRDSLAEMGYLEFYAE